MTDPHTTYHARIDDESGDVLVLVRLRTAAGSTYGERYQLGEGWVEDARAFDVMLNGQDYDLLDEDEAEDLAGRIEDQA
jgi:hypothetical protein